MRLSATAVATAATYVHLLAYGVGNVHAFRVTHPSPARTGATPQVMNSYSCDSNNREAGPLSCSGGRSSPVGSSSWSSFSSFLSSRQPLSPLLSSSQQNGLPWSWRSSSSLATTRGTQLSMRAGGGRGGQGGKGESAQNRALAAVVYLLPMLDGIECGENLFRVVPELGAAMYTILAPALAVWDNVPFLPLVMFVLLTISARRQNTSRFVRFNIQQAILVDVCTIVLGLLGTAVGYLVPEGEQVLTNFAFYCLIAAVVYAVAETVRGRTANEIPLISAVAEMQIGP